MYADSDAMSKAASAFYKLGLEQGKKIGRCEAMKEMRETTTAFLKSNEKAMEIISELTATERAERQ